MYNLIDLLNVHNYYYYYYYYYYYFYNNFIRWRALKVEKVKHSE